MNFKLDEKNYNNIMTRLKENIGSQGRSFKLTRGCLADSPVCSHSKESNNRQFLMIPNILESIREINPTEEKMYSLFYTKARFEQSRTGQKLEEIKVKIPMKDLKYSLKAEHPTIKKYYNHLEELGLFELYRNSNNAVESVVCKLNLEYFSQDEFMGLLNFIADNEKIYRSMTTYDYSVLDAYMNIDSKARVEELKGNESEMDFEF